jgi:hypothetical protein
VIVQLNKKILAHSLLLVVRRKRLSKKRDGDAPTFRSGGEATFSRLSVQLVDDNGRYPATIHCYARGAVFVIEVAVRFSIGITALFTERAPICRI